MGTWLSTGEGAHVSPSRPAAPLLSFCHASQRPPWTGFTGTYSLLALPMVMPCVHADGAAGHNPRALGRFRPWSFLPEVAACTWRAARAGTEAQTRGQTGGSQKCSAARRGQIGNESGKKIQELKRLPRPKRQGRCHGRARGPMEAARHREVLSSRKNLFSVLRGK